MRERGVLAADRIGDADAERVTLAGDFIPVLGPNGPCMAAAFAAACSSASAGGQDRTSDRIC